MRMYRLVSGICAFIAFALAFFTAPLKAEDDGIDWLSDYREAVRQAKQTQKPIFLEYRCEA